MFVNAPDKGVNNLVAQSRYLSRNLLAVVLLGP